MSDGRHLATALRALAHRGWHRIVDRDALQVCWQCAASRMLALAARFWLVHSVVSRALRRLCLCRLHKRQRQLSLHSLERFGAGAFATQMGQSLIEFGIDIAHPRDETNDGHYQLDKSHRRDHLLQPGAHLFQVRNMG